MNILVRKVLLAIFAFYCCEISAQDCNVVQTKPIASTQQGGYSFEYYSALGKGCRLYRLRNHPGGLKTPVLWKSSTEVFFDFVLPACPGPQDTCGWFNVTKTAWKPYDDKSLLSYGLNKDEYNESPEAYLEAQRQASTGARVPPIITSIFGAIADAQGEPVEIGIRVASFATQSEKSNFQLKYAFTVLAGGVEMQVGTSNTRSEGAGITLVWQSAESPSFTEHLAKVEMRRLKPERTLTVEMVTPGLEVRWNSLILIQRGEVIFSTTAPAYGAKKD